MRFAKPSFYAMCVAMIATAVLAWTTSPWWWLATGALFPLAVVGTYDVIQTKNAILRNFPILGHVRYIAEAISPEIQQYFIERHTDGTPISENHRNLIYGRSEGETPTHPFGSEYGFAPVGYVGLLHTMYPATVLDEPPRIDIGNEQCAHPYSASLLNISAMSYGALGPTAIQALAAGARRGGFYINTGEGSLTTYHLSGRGAIVWQIGTGYFGCRTHDGGFDAEAFQKHAAHAQVKMIELKLSQGAKPGHGGVLPAKKNSAEIAKIRMVEPHTTVYSPPGHREFNDAAGLLRFIERLRKLCGGKPVGFKLCLGRTDDLTELCKTMVELNIVPDFITVDGAEGGTGAAPLEFSDSVGLPIRVALPIVDRTLRDAGVRDRIRIIASGKVLTGYDLLDLLSLGADLCNAARGFMLSLGCIQALRCNKNSCPSGVATTDPRLYRGLVPEQKEHRVASFHRKTLESALQLAAAAGVANPTELTRDSFVATEHVQTHPRS